MKLSHTLFKITALQASLLASFSYAAPTELESIEVTGTRNAARYEYLKETNNTATKTDSAMEETPQSISIVTRRHLDEREPQDIAETLAYTSGASGGYRGENTHMEMSVRGIGGKSDGGALPTFWDGLSYNASLEINPYVIDRVEVFKGPASVLYGQSNPGGLVNLVTKEATGSNENEIIVKTGSGNRAEIGVDLDNEITPQLAYRFVADVKQVNWQAGKDARLRALTLAPSLLWKPSEQTSLMLKAFYERQPEAGDRNFLPDVGLVTPINGQYIPLDFFSSDPNYHNLNNSKFQLAYKLDHKFTDDLSLRQNVRYAKYDNYLQSLIVWFAGKDSELVRKARIFDETFREFQADTQLEWKLSTANIQHTVLFGLDYLDRHNSLISNLGDAPSIDWQKPVYGVSVDAPPLVMDEDTKVNQLGVYVQDQMQVGNWHFLLGGRYDHAKMTFDDNLKKSQRRQSDSKFIWRAGALYKLGMGISPYINYSTSFLPEAGVNELGQSLKPTSASEYEVGVKYQPNEKVLLTTSWFNIDQSNVTVYEPVTWNKSQIGKIRTRGMEVELQGDITPLWGISGNYTYLDKQVREDVNPKNIGNSQWGVAKHSASLWTDYQFSSIVPGLSIGTGIRYIGKTWGDNGNTFRVPAFTLWDLKMAYKPGQVMSVLKGSTVQLNIQNVTNKKYVASCANTSACFYGKGRRVTLSAGYRW